MISFASVADERWELLGCGLGCLNCDLFDFGIWMISLCVGRGELAEVVLVD